MDAETSEGLALVFSNEIPHRVRMIKNKVGDGKKRRRGMLNFFIVDPKKPLGNVNVVLYI